MYVICTYHYVTSINTTRSELKVLNSIIHVVYFIYFRLGIQFRTSLRHEPVVKSVIYFYLSYISMNSHSNFDYSGEIALISDCIQSFIEKSSNIPPLALFFSWTICNLERRMKQRTNPLNFISPDSSSEKSF